MVVVVDDWPVDNCFSNDCRNFSPKYMLTAPSSSLIEPPLYRKGMAMVKFVCENFAAPTREAQVILGWRPGWRCRLTRPSTSRSGWKMTGSLIELNVIVPWWTARLTCCLASSTLLDALRSLRSQINLSCLVVPQFLGVVTGTRATNVQC